MTQLEGGDLLPEYLGTEDLQDLIAEGLIQDVSKSPDSTHIEVDLTNPKFKLKREKVFKDADYRVNPLAVLMSTDEVPHLSIEDEEDDTGNGRASNTTLNHRALKKNPKPKTRRKQTLRVLSQSSKHTYILDELFGNAEFQSKLHVKFQCSAEQSRLVEWLRFRGSEPFNLVEFSHGDNSLHHGKSLARYEENSRNLLRFLYFVGYVTQVKTR
ncbi:hypothetical protein PHPALM_27789 [Phytophthora palmivora]|uniref:Uncharacterized protein n=1 Tax=Phytophthora palmivora TaxID=4796 RepID=A0A2P4XBR2_9STRA|nr:hypothetical protein PHPALM_27789 [Phytophthora palmivora]